MARSAIVGINSRLPRPSLNLIAIRLELRGREPRRGQALVELALTFTILAMLMVGTLDFARVFYFDIMVSAAAMEGARASAAGLPDIDPHEDGPDVVEAVVSSAPAWLPASNIKSISPAPGLRAVLVTPVWTTVTVEYSFKPITPLAANLVGSEVKVARSVSQRMRTPCAYYDGTAC